MDAQSIYNNVVHGNGSSLDKIFLEYKDYCTKFLQNKYNIRYDDALDHFCEAMYILRGNITQKKLKDASGLRNYLLTICINLVKKDIRKNVSQKKKEDVIRLLFYDQGYNEHEGISQKQKLIEICKNTLAALSESCQKVLTLYYIHNLSMKDIAEELNYASSDVAKSAKSRCYKKWMTSVKQSL